MRVVAGKVKGKRLESPKGLDIRPTSDRVREALFSILAPRIEGARFLDLFAGTGANGIEALSRGAAWSTFVDSQARALAVVARNLETTSLAGVADRLRLDLPKDLPLLSQRAAPYEVIFADPPYAFSEYGALLEALQHTCLLAKGGVLVVEHDRRVSVRTKSSALTSFRESSYGDTVLSFFS